MQVLPNLAVPAGEWSDKLVIGYAGGYDFKVCEPGPLQIAISKDVARWLLNICLLHWLPHCHVWDTDSHSHTVGRTLVDMAKVEHRKMRTGQSRFLKLDWAEQLALLY